MTLSQLLLYSQKEDQRFISGGKEEEISYLQFHFKRFKLLFSLLKKEPSSKLLDIGTTPFSFFVNENSNHKVYAFDYNNLLKERCEALVGGGRGRILPRKSAGNAKKEGEGGGWESITGFSARTSFTADRAGMRDER